MPVITDVEGLPVGDPEGNELGVVSHVLFHPREPRAIALEVTPPKLAVVIERKPRFLPIRPDSFVTCGGSSFVEWDAKKLPSKGAVEKELGVSIDETVIWRNMQVRLAGGARAGYVADVLFSRKTGHVLKLLLSEGSVADFAVGRREVPGELVEGFDGEAVIIDKSFLVAAPSSGGLAAASGKSAAYAKQGAEKAADAVFAAGVVGLGMVEKSFRSGLGRKAMRSLRKARKAVGGDE